MDVDAGEAARHCRQPTPPFRPTSTTGWTTRSGRCLKKTGPLRVCRALRLFVGSRRTAHDRVRPGARADSVEAARQRQPRRGRKGHQGLFLSSSPRTMLTRSPPQKPDIFLLAGGTDGGNTGLSFCTTPRVLAGVDAASFPVVIAGNRSAAQTVPAAFWKAARPFVCENVMPRFGVAQHRAHAGNAFATSFWSASSRPRGCRKRKRADFGHYDAHPVGHADGHAAAG